MLQQTRLLMDDVGLPPALAGFVFGATVFGYNFTAPNRLRRWPAWGAGLASGYCFFSLTPVQQIAAVLPALIWLLYYDMHSGRSAGLRMHPALKPVAIALAWTWVTVLLPLPLFQWTGAAVIFVGRAAFIFPLALAYDLCDRLYDRRHGLVTLVMQLGPSRALRLIDAALLLAALCCGLNAALGVYPTALALALLASLVLSRITIRLVTPKTAWGDWRKVLIDGLMVLQLLLVWMAKM